MDLKKGDEVISSPMTCPATNEPLYNSNINVRFADIDRYTGNLCLKSVKRLITKKTRAIIVVHWGGQPLDILDTKKTLQKIKILKL